uniref:hypothetical protein n=1 Tax=Bradyrhizobium sp. (strain ORS 278) TaxID=114615 RepID=UPI001389F035|nr:hypothetical protein [Bradyrhizobium sp. ORS 278]
MIAPAMSAPNKPRMGDRTVPDVIMDVPLVDRLARAAVVSAGSFEISCLSSLLVALWTCA